MDGKKKVTSIIVAFLTFVAGVLILATYAKMAADIGGIHLPNMGQVKFEMYCGLAFSVLMIIVSIVNLIRGIKGLGGEANTLKLLNLGIALPCLFVAITNIDALIRVGNRGYKGPVISYVAACFGILGCLCFVIACIAGERKMVVARIATAVTAISGIVIGVAPLVNAGKYADGLYITTYVFLILASLSLIGAAIVLDNSFKRKFKPRANAYGSYQSRPTPASQPTSASDELLKLKQLKDQGLISEAEFNEKKQKYIDKL